MNAVLDPRRPAEIQLDWRWRDQGQLVMTARAGVLECRATASGSWCIFCGGTIVQMGETTANLPITRVAEEAAMARAQLAAEAAVRVLGLAILRDAGLDVSIATPADLCAVHAYGSLAKHTLEQRIFPGVARLIDEGTYPEVRAILDAGEAILQDIPNGTVNAGDIGLYWDTLARFSCPIEGLGTGATSPDVEDSSLEIARLREEADTMRRWAETAAAAENANARELAEVRAVLDGEWGRGEGPSPGWVYHDNMWYRDEGSGLERRVARHRWWLLRIPRGKMGPADILAEGRADSNRAAMVAVDAVPSPTDPPPTVYQASIPPKDPS